MPNGWKKNAAYLNTQEYTHKEYVEEKNKFRKWKKEYGIHNKSIEFALGDVNTNKMQNNKASAIKLSSGGLKLRNIGVSTRWGQDLYGHYYLDEEYVEEEHFWGGWIKGAGIFRTSNKDPIYDYIFKFVKKGKINANDKNNRYTTDSSHIKWLKHQWKDTDKTCRKKNNERISDHAKPKKKKHISYKYSEQSCSICLDTNWEHRMKAIKCSSKQKNKNYICMSCVEKLKDRWGDANCPLCRSHLIETTSINEYCAKYL
jgi:hypothetical protein